MQNLVKNEIIEVSDYNESVKLISDLFSKNNDLSFIILVDKEHHNIFTSKQFICNSNDEKLRNISNIHNQFYFETDFFQNNFDFIQFQECFLIFVGANAYKMARSLQMKHITSIITKNDLNKINIQEINENYANIIKDSKVNMQDRDISEAFKEKLNGPDAVIDFLRNLTEESLLSLIHI